MSATERDLICGYLAAQRNHVVDVVEALAERDDRAERRAVLPSGWTSLALLRHLTVDVERFWFGAVMVNDPAVHAFFATEPDGWLVPDEVDAATVIAEYRATWVRSDEIIAAHDLDEPPAWWPVELFGPESFANLRHVILHVMNETACHAGHLDAVRELVDGTRRLVLT